MSPERREPVDLPTLRPVGWDGEPYAAWPRSESAAPNVEPTTSATRKAPSAGHREPGLGTVAGNRRTRKLGSLGAGGRADRSNQSMFTSGARRGPQPEFVVFKAVPSALRLTARGIC